MKIGLVGVVAGIGLLALAGTSQAAVLTIDLNDYASAVDTSPACSWDDTVTDTTGGVDVKVALDAATYFASTGGGHITIAWNLDTPTAATSISTTLALSIEGLRTCRRQCGHR